MTRPIARAVTPVLAVATLVACGDDGIADTFAEATGSSSTSSSSTETGTTSTAGSTSTDDGEETTGGSGTTGTTTTGGPVGCSAIDFLYVIDNSSTMLPHQDALRAAFPAFSTTIQGTVPASLDYHAMVVKTDEGWGGDCAEECAMLGGCMLDPTFACDMQLRGCDAQLGAGVRFPYGTGGTNLPCEIVGEQRYVTGNEPDVNPAFLCLAGLGTRTYDAPRTAEATLAALASEANGPGGCNEGFLRDEALLVVTIVSDKDDDDSPGDPAAWAQAVLAAKGGDAGAVVLLGILDDDAACLDDPETSDDLAAMVATFPNAASTSICSDDYEQFLLDAIDLVGATCDAWSPPASLAMSRVRSSCGSASLGTLSRRGRNVSLRKRPLGALSRRKRNISLRKRRLGALSRRKRNITLRKRPPRITVPPG